MTATELDRSVPSRELDAAVARTLMWKDVCETKIQNVKAVDWFGVTGSRWKRVPGYSTDTGSTHWAEMIAWLESHVGWVQIRVVTYAGYLNVTIGSDWFPSPLVFTAPTIGHALALAVLAVSERLNA